METSYIVIKFGGHTMTDPALRDAFARDLAPLAREGRRCVVVHGGGPQISSLLKRLDIPSRFEEGLRVTDDAAMEAVEMVLSGQVNKELVGAFTRLGVPSTGLSGRDGDPLLLARMRSTSRPMCAVEKYSRMSNAAWCSSVPDSAYFRNGAMPIVWIAGTKLPVRSRGAKSRMMPGRRKANSTALAAFMPGVSEKRSMANPRKKAHSISPLRGVSESSFRIM